MARPSLLVISFSDVSSDPRVSRQIDALRRRYDLTVAGTARPRDPEIPFVELDRYIAPAQGSPLQTARRLGLLAARRNDRVYWSNPAVRRARRTLAAAEADVVLANDLQTLPLALSLHKGPVVFDAHEYSPREFDSRWWRLMWQPYFEDMCRRYITRAAAMTTVGWAIAERYREDTGVQPTVLPNAPPYHDLEPSPVELPFRLIHYGWADPSRRLDRMIETMRHLDERFRLDFLLLEEPRREVERLKKLAAGDDRIRFLRPVPMRDLVTFANKYDIGVYLLDPGSFNRRYALPNKFFEFVQARLAVAIGPSPEMARLVREWQLGVVARDFTPAGLAAELSALTPERVAELKRRSAAASRHLSAEAAGETLLTTIERALVVVA